MALDGPGIPPRPVGRGLSAGERVIQLPLHKFYYMVLGMCCESAVSNEEPIVAHDRLRADTASCVNALHRAA